LPSGKTAKLIKSVLAIISIFILVTPLKDVDFSKFNFNNLFSTKIDIDNTFVENRSKEKIKTLEKDIENVLLNNGYKGVLISINSDDKQKINNINNVFVDLTNLVLLDNNLNIDKYTKIVAIINKYIDVEKENIIFYE